MKVNVNEVIVNDRIRKDLGDVESLAASFKRYGQITPIVINKKNALIAGGRRLKAAKLLGWTTINAIIMDSTDELECLEIEVEENSHRKEFNEEEAAAAAQKLYKLRNPSLFRRILNAIGRFFKRIFGKKDK